MISQNIPLKCSLDFMKFYRSELISLLESSNDNSISELLQSIPPSEAVKLLASLNPETGSEMLTRLPVEIKKQLLPIVDPERLCLFVSRLGKKDRDELLELLPRALSKEIQEITSYPADSSGHFMDPRPVLFYLDDTVETALNKIRLLKNRRITDLHIVDHQGVLEGKLSLQELAVSDSTLKLADIKHSETVTVNAMSSKDEVVELMETHTLASIPVIDIDNKLVGVIRHDALMDIVQQDAAEEMQSMVGVSPEERALSKVNFSIRKRLPWLSINLITTFLAAFVVGLFEDTIAKVTALAVLLPVVAGQSGNTGMQAQAVTMRGLALREIRLRHWWRMLHKEGRVGLVNGLIIGVICAGAVYVWSRSLGLAFVMGTSMVIAMVAASLSGAAIPLILSATGQDPAQSSSIILTTITDIVGFLCFLGLATLLSGMLVGL